MVATFCSPLTSSAAAAESRHLAQTSDTSSAISLRYLYDISTTSRRHLGDISAPQRRARGKDEAGGHARLGGEGVGDDRRLSRYTRDKARCS